jgi:hypothetical protein
MEWQTFFDRLIEPPWFPFTAGQRIDVLCG